MRQNQLFLFCLVELNCTKLQCPQLRSELDRLGPNSDFFEQSGPKKVRIDHQKSEFVDENNVQILMALKNCYIEGILINYYDPSLDFAIGSLSQL